MSKKAKIILVSSISAFVLIAAIVVMVLFVPLNGKKNDYYWAYGDEFKIEDVKTVQKKAGEDFKILQLADIQLWSGADENKRALDMCAKVVDETKPDLIILTGDNVSGITIPSLMKKLIKTFEGFKIPWAATFGNHDSEIKATVNYLGDLLLDTEYCLFSKGPNNLYGSGNYAINVVEGDKHLQTLFMIDNGRYIKYPDGTTKEGGVTYEQQVWYKWNILGMEKELGYRVPSMTFSHFAPPQMATAIKTLAVKDGDGVYTVPEELGFGTCAYLPGVAPRDTGFFDLMKELNSTHSMFFGHDHENDASITYDGITMTYGLKAGPSPKPWNDAKRYGGTMIKVNSSNKVSIEHVVAETVK